MGRVSQFFLTAGWIRDLSSSIKASTHRSSNHSPEARFENTRLDDDGSNSKRWVLCGNPCPKFEIVFFCQAVVLYIVIVVSIYNLTKDNGKSNLWTALLSSSLGHLVPNPSVTLSANA